MIRNFTARLSEMSSVTPSSFRKLIVKKATPIFKEAVEIIPQELRRLQSNEVLIKNKYIGINASDVNVAAGRYFKEKLTLPFDVGFEGIGEIIDLGENVSELKYGQPVIYMKFGAFSEYMYISEEDVIPVTTTSPQLLPLLVSGTTASLSLDKCGHIIPGEKVLITAAAGGTGHIAVQWAKNAGCHVIGICSSVDKVNFLKSIGCDRPINYKEECLKDVLCKEYPNGIDVIWESIGGKMFHTLRKHLAIKGRLIVIGAISRYLKENLTNDVNEDIAMKLLLKSSTLSGFFLMHYTSDIPHYLSLLVRQFHEENLKIQIDDGSSQGKTFKGLEDITRAVEHLYSGRNKGKVIVAL